MYGTPGWPGPPVRKRRTPFGAALLSAVATCRSSVPGILPLWSSGTGRVEQVNPGWFLHGCAPVSFGVAATGWDARTLAMGRDAPAAWPLRPATSAATTAATSSRDRICGLSPLGVAH